jgi:hypothetical protein
VLAGVVELPKEASVALSAVHAARRAAINHIVPLCWAVKSTQRRGVTYALTSPFYLNWNPSRSIELGLREWRVRSLLAEAPKEQRRDQNPPSEFRAALRAGSEDLASKLKVARKRVKDQETALHLKDLQFELEDGR